MTERQRLLSAIRGNPDLVARLLLVAEPDPTELVAQDKHALSHFLPLLDGLDHERFAVLALNRRNRAIACEVLTVGNDGYCIVDPKQIYRWALMQGRSGATAVILAHNHPSGDPTPSAQDIAVTRKVVQAGTMLGIRCLDHLVIGSGGSYCSLATRGEM